MHTRQVGALPHAVCGEVWELRKMCTNVGMCHMEIRHVVLKGVYKDNVTGWQPCCEHVILMHMLLYVLLMSPWSGGCFQPGTEAFAIPGFFCHPMLPWGAHDEV